MGEYCGNRTQFPESSSQSVARKVRPGEKVLIGSRLSHSISAIQAKVSTSSKTRQATQISTVLSKTSERHERLVRNSSSVDEAPFHVPCASRCFCRADQCDFQATERTDSAPQKQS